MPTKDGSADKSDEKYVAEASRRRARPAAVARRHLPTPFRADQRALDRLSANRDDPIQRSRSREQREGPSPSSIA